MKVSLLAATQVFPVDRLLNTRLLTRIRTVTNQGIEESTSADMVAEIAGRLCYDSFHLPNPHTQTNETYLANIIKQRHFSVMEHASATFLVEDVSRSLLMELRTHRHTSFSARSTRYVDEADSNFIVPPRMRAHLGDLTHFEAGTAATFSLELQTLMEHSSELYTEIFNHLIAQGATRKEAREAAREVLPGMTSTEFVVTANHHGWRELLAKRMAPGAAAEIRELSTEILRHLKRIAPAIYQDMN
ncbi:FAD-dependent thymidylate synthase [Streptomyces sp. NPDC017448]|uniref:FAD-dependent thymidylate synthase n=1 Tax=Streptomyces sp. NPDC017448 TaxID=3364996 RepID=UPI00379B5655